MMSAVTGGSGAGGVRALPSMETGVLERQQQNIREAQAAAEQSRREMKAQIESFAGKGAASNAYRMAQILGAPPEQLNLLKSG